MRRFGASLLAVFLVLLLFVPHAAQAWSVTGSEAGSIPPGCGNGDTRVFNVTTQQFDTCAPLAGGGDMLASIWATSGKIKQATGGTGADTSATTGHPYISAGNWIFLTSPQLASALGLSTVATSGSYNDLTSKPTLGTAAAKDFPATGNASASQLVQGNDTRLSDARPPATSGSPTPGHVAKWNNATTLEDGGALSPVATSGSYPDLINKPTLGTAATKDFPATGDASSTQVVQGNDTRLSDARTPTSHNQAETTLTFTDVLTNNASITKHGFLPKLDNVVTHFLNGQGGWSSPAGGGDMLAADYALAGKIKPATGGTGVDTSATTGHPSVSAGSWSFLSNAQLISALGLATVSTSGSYLDLTNKPNLHTVATSGSYNDLTSKPTLGTAAAKDFPATGNASASQLVQGNDTRLSDARTPATNGTPTAGHVATWYNQSTLQDGGTLAPVATSGSYADLTSKPTLGTAAAKDVAATGNASSTEVVQGNDTRLTDTRTPATNGTPTPGHVTKWHDATTLADGGVLRADNATASHYPYIDASGNVVNATIGNGLVDTTGTLSVNYGTANPAMNGTAAPGGAATVSRSDHVHPTDTSRLSASQKFTACTTIKDPTAGSDHQVFRAGVAMTVTNVHCLATGGTSLTGSLQECDANGGTCAGVDGATTMICTAGSSVNDDGSLSNPGIDAGDYIKWDTASVSGTQTELIVCFDYTLP